MNGAGGDVTRYQVAVFRIPLLEEIKPLVLGDLFRRTRVLRRLRNPHAATLAAGRFAHQPAFVFAGDGSGMHLNEFAVSVVNTLLKQRGLRGASANDGISRAAKDGADAARAEDRGVAGERFDLHG